MSTLPPDAVALLTRHDQALLHLQVAQHPALPTAAAVLDEPPC